MRRRLGGLEAIAPQRLHAMYLGMSGEISRPLPKLRLKQSVMKLQIALAGRGSWQLYVVMGVSCSCIVGMERALKVPETFKKSEF
jgi:hypothetical protein